MARPEAPRWRRRPALALIARGAAFVLPLVAGAAAAALVLLAFSGWTEGWRVAWWTCAIAASVLVAMACLPLARRLSALGLLLGLEIEFPNPPPSRARVALRASSVAAMQEQLATSAQLETTDELVTTRMATASALGVLRVLHIRGGEFPRIATTLVIAACLALATVAVTPDRAESPTAPTAAGQALGVTSTTGVAIPGSEAPANAPNPTTTTPPRGREVVTPPPAPSPPSSDARATDSVVPSPPKASTSTEVAAAQSRAKESDREAGVADTETASPSATASVGEALRAPAAAAAALLPPPSTGDSEVALAAAVPTARFALTAAVAPTSDASPIAEPTVALAADTVAVPTAGVAAVVDLAPVETSPIVEPVVDALPADTVEAPTSGVLVDVDVRLAVPTETDEPTALTPSQIALDLQPVPPSATPDDAGNVSTVTDQWSLGSCDQEASPEPA